MSDDPGYFGDKNAFSLRDLPSEERTDALRKEIEKTLLELEPPCTFRWWPEMAIDVAELLVTRLTEAKLVA